MKKSRGVTNGRMFYYRGVHSVQFEPPPPHQCIQTINQDNRGPWNVTGRLAHGYANCKYANPNAIQLGKVQRARSHLPGNHNAHILGTNKKNALDGIAQGYATNQLCIQLTFVLQ